MGEFLPEPVELVLGKPALEEGARVDAGRRVSLEEHLVAGFAVVLAAEEVVEAHLVQAGRAGVGGDVAAYAHAGAVRAGHHHGGVPPDVRPDPTLDVLVAREPRLVLGRDGVDVVGAAQAGHADLLLARPRSSRRSITYLARVRPRVRTTESNDSTHSRVSSGAMSGKWVGNPSLMIGNC